MKKYKTTFRYFIYLFCNGKKKRLLHRYARKSTILNVWEEMITQKPPRFIKTNSGKSRTETNFELALMYPKRKTNKKIYKKDHLGRNVEIIYDDDNLTIRELVPYWVEEYIYDYDLKKRIRYHELMDILLKVNDIAQLFKLNSKVILQVDDNFRVFACKNIPDGERLFNLLREDLLEKNRGNFIFVKDIVTHQRVLLYRMLEEKGYKHLDLLRHYTY